MTDYIRTPRAGQRAPCPVLPSGGVTFAKVIVHAILAGIYGGLVVALVLVLGNPGAASRGGGAGLSLLLVVLLYALAAGLAWPLLYAGVRFFASHPLRLPWLSLRYLVGFHAVNTAVILAAGWMMLSEHRAALAPRDAERLAGARPWLSLASARNLRATRRRRIGCRAGWYRCARSLWVLVFRSGQPQR